MDKKKVGVITMHRVWNFGSALQAYATQYIIESLGYKCELIDYIYPNLEHSAYQNTLSEQKTLNITCILRLLASRIKSKFTLHGPNLFEKFYQENYHCSPKQYDSRLKLNEDCPIYDIYMTGSDQVWNPKYIGFDTNFMLTFAPKDAYKISYGSSFATSKIPSCLELIYSNALSQYSELSVREESGVKIIENLTGKKAKVVCDPTLLLNADQWNVLANKSIFKTNKKYLLVYVMGYAYNPYPEIYNYIERVNKKLNLSIIYLNTKPGRLKGKYKEINVPNIGPNEFLWLIANANYIITDSFHGTAFSINFHKKFISCIKIKNNTDSRIIDLLRRIGAEDHAVEYEKDNIINYENLSDMQINNLNDFRIESQNYISKALKNKISQ